MTERQQLNTRRFETLLGLFAPALDLLLAAGERISRIAEREQLDEAPAPPAGSIAPRSPGARAPRGLPPGGPRARP